MGIPLNVYDFDDTIFRGDSTRAFWLYCLRRAPRLIRWLPYQCVFAIRYCVGSIGKEALKQGFFSFLRDIPDASEWAEDFWELHFSRIYSWYLAQKQPDDLVISASPEFLLVPVCRRMGIRAPIASRIDPHTGRYDGRNCKGKEKVARFSSEFPDGVIDAFYSDSRSDEPLANLAKTAYFVKGDTRSAWKSAE